MANHGLMASRGYRGEVTRDSLIASAVKRWQETLVDDSGRNQLAYYRDLKVGTLSLDGAHEPHLAQLLAGRPVALRHLFPQAESRRLPDGGDSGADTTSGVAAEGLRGSISHAEAMKRMRAVRTHMRTWAEERGVEVG